MEYHKIYTGPSLKTQLTAEHVSLVDRVTDLDPMDNPSSNVLSVSSDYYIASCRDNDDIELNLPFADVRWFLALVLVAMNPWQTQYARKRLFDENDRTLGVFALTSRIRDRANSANSLLMSMPRGERWPTTFCDSFWKIPKKNTVNGSDLFVSLHTYFDMLFIQNGSRVDRWIHRGSHRSHIGVFGVISYRRGSICFRFRGTTTFTLKRDPSIDEETLVSIIYFRIGIAEVRFDDW